VKPIQSGPTYQEMLHPESLPPAFRAEAVASATTAADPINLFNITWRGPDNHIRHVVLPHELTGVEANIVVLVGRHFPSGSHKVGPAYATLMEGELAGEIEPGRHTIIGPSTGNFGIGVAYIARLKGYQAIIVMPDGMSRERYQRIQHYGGALDLTPGSESDVILVLERTETYRQDSRNKVLAQFELLSNYRFHRYVTGRSALEAAKQYGNGRIAAFVAAPGSAGTLAAGDEIKACFPDCVVCAPEPKECSTLFNNGCGTHSIEGIGDKMVSLIHNILTTDYVMMIHDQDCVIGLELVERQAPLLERTLGLPMGRLSCLEGVFGVSGLCNVLGAIRIARYLNLGASDNVVTIATDGFDRYPSVLSNLKQRRGPLDDFTLSNWLEEVFRGGDPQDVLDVRPRDQKHRLFEYKERIWIARGYPCFYMETMKSPSFWEEEFEKIEGIDRDLVSARERS